MRLACLYLTVLVSLGCALGCTPGSDVSRELGARCQSHANCADLCLADPEFPDGFCSLNCNSDLACPGRSACAAIDQGVCLFRCTEQSDCEFLGAGWQCAATPAPAGGQVSVCTGG